MLIKKLSVFVSLLLLISVITTSCKDNPTPKPRGYFRIDTPKNEYQEYKSIHPYSFMYSKYSVAMDYITDSSWVNIIYPKYGATIHLTYHDVDNDLNEHFETTRTLVYKHHIKADAIFEEIFINDTTKVYGILYDIEGNAASSINFYVTDSTDNLVRGALYFNVKPNIDSLSPLIDYIKTDISHMMETFEWKDKN